MKNLVNNPTSRQKEFPGIGNVLFEQSRRARHLSISLRPFSRVRVAVPVGVSFAMAEHFVLSKSAWIRKHLPRVVAMEERHEALEKKSVEIDPGEGRRLLADRVAALAALHGYACNRVTVRRQKTRWGSCSAVNNISLNLKLLLLPAELMDFVIIHELVHTKIKNHGPEFRRELLRIEPGAEELERRVNSYFLRLL